MRNQADLDRLLVRRDGSRLSGQIDVQPSTRFEWLRDENNVSTRVSLRLASLLPRDWIDPGAVLQGLMPPSTDSVCDVTIAAASEER